MLQIVLGSGVWGHADQFNPENIHYSASKDIGLAHVDEIQSYDVPLARIPEAHGH